MGLLSEFERYEVSGPILDVIKKIMTMDIAQPLSNKVRDFVRDGGSEGGSGTSIKIDSIDCTGGNEGMSVKVKNCHEPLPADTTCVDIITITVGGGCKMGGVDINIREAQEPVSAPTPSTQDSAGGSHDHGTSWIDTIQIPSTGL